MSQTTNDPAAQATAALEEPMGVEAPLPPGVGEGPVALLRDNLFKDAKNTVLTLVFGAILIYIAYRAFGFVFLNTKIGPDGEPRSAWDVVRDGPLVVYMVGNQFGRTGVAFWQLWAAIYTITLIMGLGIATRDPDAPPTTRRTMLGIITPPVLALVIILSMTRTILPTLLTLGMVVPYLLGRFGRGALPARVLAHRGLIAVGLVVVAFLLVTDARPVTINNFGGLLLTLMVSFIAIVACFPIGVVLALIRRSSFPLLRPIAVIYIEIIRGVPLITLLFMGQFAIGFFFPPGFDPPGRIPRAIIMITLFSAAYVAEIVRGGLQSVPNGQVEAGHAVGLSTLTITRKIVLPQALRNSIPALVGQFISLLKDTTLLTIIGVLDLLGVTEPILANPDFANQRFTPEAFAFTAFLFWVMCYSMSRASQRLETRLGVGTR